MRVALDATPLIGTRTGIGVFVAELLRSLQASEQEGIDIEIAPYTLSVGARLRGKTQGAWVPIPAGKAATVWRHFKGPRIERFVGGGDVVHGTNYLVPPSSHPRLVTVHDLSFLREPVAASAPIARFDRAVADAVNTGAVVHAISNYVADEIRDRFAAPDGRVVYPGVQPRPSTTEPKGTSPVLVTLGVTQRRKGISDLISAFGLIAQANKSVELHIIGPAGDDENRTNQLVRRLPASIAARVQRIGFVDDEERDRRIADATILVHPSHYEGFGLPVVEAMASGTPVVTTTGGALPEIAGDAALMVDPGDVDALASALTHVLEDEQTRAHLIQAGRDRAARFSWADTASGLIDVYDSFL